jgi:hypothetical protein
MSGALALPGSIHARLDAIARACEEGFVTIGKTFETIMRSQAEVHAADVDRCTKLLAGSEAQRAEMHRMVAQAERERDSARDTAALQAKTIGEQATELQRLRLELVAARALRGSL